MAKQVLKQFSELKVAKRIELTALGIFHVVFRGEQEKAFEPREGSEIHRVWKMGTGKLDLRQQRAWYLFRRDVDEAHGKSGSVCSAYGEQISTSDGSDFKAPVAYTNKQYERIRRLFENHLDKGEQRLLYDLLQNDLRASELKLEIIGLLRSGYQGDGDARTAGVVHIQTLLNRVARFYNC